MLNFIIGLAAGVWRSFVLMVLWNWFIAAPFNAPVVNLAMAYVMVMVAMLLTAQVPINFKDQTMQDKVTHTVILFVWPATALLIGWIIHLFGN